MRGLFGGVVILSLELYKKAVVQNEILDNRFFIKGVG